MAILIAIILICMLIYFSYIFSKIQKQKVNPKTPKESDDKLGFESCHNMQKQFKEAYLWACDVFGVDRNVYDDLYSKILIYPSLGVEYFTYYEVSNCLYKYPNIPRTNYTISDWDNPYQQGKFALEFVGIVNSMKKILDGEEIKLFVKYQLPYKDLLTNKFEVDKMKLFSLPE